MYMLPHTHTNSGTAKIRNFVCVHVYFTFNIECGVWQSKRKN